MRPKFCGIGQFDNTGWESYHMKIELDLIEENIIPEDNIWKLIISSFSDMPRESRNIFEVKIEGLNKNCSQINEISIINATTNRSIWGAIPIKRFKDEGCSPSDTKLIIELPGGIEYVSTNTFSDEQWSHLVLHEESFQSVDAARMINRKRHKKSKNINRRKHSKKHRKKHGKKYSKKHGRKSKKHKKSKKHNKPKKQSKSNKHRKSKK
jgi:hypothetical protein